MTVIFIGGMSAAGKTAAAARLGSRLRLPVLRLDAVANLVQAAIPDRERFTPSAQRLARALVGELLDAEAQCIAEGGWLRPPDAALLQARGLVAAFCGYEHTTAAERLRLLQRAPGTAHWVIGKPEAEARAWIERQIAGSRLCRALGEKHALLYVDFTRIDEGIERLCDALSVLPHVAAAKRA